MVCQVCVCGANSLSSAPNQRRNEIKHPLYLILEQNGRSDLPSFFMDRCPKNEATARNFVWNKSSSHSQEKWKNLLGGGVDVTPTPLEC